MYKKLFLLSVIIWLITAGVFAKFFISGQTQKSSDNRQAVMLTESERDVVLGEMRAVLKAVNGTLKAVANNDFKQASIEAKAAGAGMAVDINPVLMAKLPLEFKKFGMSMHGDFDQYSKDLANGMNQQQAIQRLGEITNKCVTCHGTYRLSSN